MSFVPDDKQNYRSFPTCSIPRSALRAQFPQFPYVRNSWSFEVSGNNIDNEDIDKYLGLQILRCSGTDVALKKSREDIRLRDGLGVFWGVSTDLSQRPCSCSLDVILRLLGQCDRQHHHALDICVADITIRVVS